MISWEWSVQLMWTTERNFIPRTRTEVSTGEPKGNESTGCYADQGTFTLTFDHEFSRSNCIQGMELKGQIWNLLYLHQKWFDCRETKSKHIDWALGLKWDHQLWLWPWHWPWIFKVKHGICYISAKMVRLPRNQKQTYRLNSMPQMWPWPWKVRCKD